MSNGEKQTSQYVMYIMQVQHYKKIKINPLSHQVTVNCDKNTKKQKASFTLNVDRC